MDPTAAESPDRLLDALRIQAAAVAAQQAALTEEEIRLQQRRAALERQEEQLAARLEEQRRRLLDLQGQVRAERAAMRQERGDYERYVTASLHELEHGCQEVKNSQDQVQVRRQRLAVLRRRLRERLRRQLAAEKNKLAEQQRSVEAEADRLRQQQTGLAEARQGYHTARELGRRQIQDRWDALAQAVRHWRDQQAREQAASQQLDARAVALAEAERALTEERQQWEAKRRDLEQELDGLENRVRQQRFLLAGGQQAAASRPADSVRYCSPLAPVLGGEGGNADSINRTV